jgi:hypothetical protein
MKSRAPQPIILPELKSRHYATSLPTIVDHPGYHPHAHCNNCGYVAGPSDCFCGYWGIRLKGQTIPIPGNTASIGHNVLSWLLAPTKRT